MKRRSEPSVLHRLPPESPDAEYGPRLYAWARRDPKAAYADLAQRFPALAARDRDHEIKILTREWPRHCKTCLMTVSWLGPKRELGGRWIHGDLGRPPHRL